MASNLVWKDIDLNDTTTPFNTDYIYRIYCGGWMMAVTVASTVLYFLPSTSGKYYGCVHYSHKSEWDYRIQEDVKNRPPGHPNYIAAVERLQYLAVESDRASKA
jgi:hypothetical protein